MKDRIEKINGAIESFFEDQPGETGYDPVHIAGMIVLTLFGITIFFWLFWSLLVYEGGLFEKIVPVISVIFTGKTFLDYGYYGLFDAGVFEGWITNITSLLFLFFFIFLASRTYKKLIKK